MQKILFLGYTDSPLIRWLEDQGHCVVSNDNKVSAEFVRNENFDFLISYGYKHIISEDILEMLKDKAINLHISYLPWNRGADPNLWSFVDNTKKGVTIHFLDKGIDTGNIIAQIEVEFDIESDTLSTTYEKLHSEIQQLFKDNWETIISGNCSRKKQAEKGSFHLSKDISKIKHLLTNGWDTPVAHFSIKK